MILGLLLLVAALSTPTPCPNDGEANCYPTPIAHSCESRLEQCEDLLRVWQRQRAACQGQLDSVIRKLAPEAVRTPQGAPTP